MTHFDDELAALLAESAADDPPPDLRSATLDNALRQRAAGRPVDAAAPCSAADAFTRTIDDLYMLLSSLSAAEWDVRAHAEHGRVRDLVAHLIGVELLSARWLDPDDDVPAQPDHVASTHDVVVALADIDPARLCEQWHTAASAVATAAATGDPARSVTFHDLSTSIDGFLVTRTFELWAHAMDIATATERPLPTLDDERMALMSSRLMAAVPLAMAYRRIPQPGRTARFVLTGSSGGCYNVALAPTEAADEPDVVIVADTIGLCRLAARRLSAVELDAAMDGDTELGQLVLAGLDAFARD